MADENGNNELAENTDHNASGSGFIVNVNQLQSMDIPLRFNRVKTDNGWIINVQEVGSRKSNSKLFNQYEKIGDCIGRG